MGEFAATATSNSTVAAAAAVRDGEMIDVPMRPWWERTSPLHLAATVSIAAAVVSLIVVAGLVIGDDRRRAAVAVLVSLPLLVGLVMLARRWMFQAHARIVRECRHRPIEAIINRVLNQPILLSEGESMRLTTRLLAAEERLGETIRVCRAAEAKRIQPIARAFEPCPLDAGEAVFAERAGAAEADDNPQMASPCARLESEDWRRLHLGVRRRGGWSVLVLDVALLGLVTYAAVRLPALSWTAYTILVMQALRWSQPHKWIGLQRGEWLAVPGGVVIRRPARRSGEWRVHLFQRAEGVLSAVRTTEEHWTLVVADRVEYAATTVMREEAEFLLRAWLSPLRPPPMERMSDLI